MCYHQPHADLHFVSVNIWQEACLYLEEMLLLEKKHCPDKPDSALIRHLKRNKVWNGEKKGSIYLKGTNFDLKNTGTSCV